MEDPAAHVGKSRAGAGELDLAVSRTLSLMPPPEPDTPSRDLLPLAEGMFERAVELAAPRLQSLVAESPDLARIKERELTNALREALEEIAPTAEGGPQTSPSLSSLPLKERWPKLGNFDMSIAWAGRQTVYAELKCGIDEATLEACAWDALKCSFALREGVGVGMLLVAAAPDSLWSKPARGCELFDAAVWDATDLRERYKAGFATWEPLCTP